MKDGKNRSSERAGQTGGRSSQGEERSEEGR